MALFKTILKEKDKQAQNQSTYKLGVRTDYKQEKTLHNWPAGSSHIQTRQPLACDAYQSSSGHPPRLSLALDQASIPGTIKRPEGQVLWLARQGMCRLWAMSFPFWKDVGKSTEQTKRKTTANDHLIHDKDSISTQGQNDGWCKDNWQVIRKIKIRQIKPHLVKKNGNRSMNDSFSQIVSHKEKEYLICSGVAKRNFLCSISFRQELTVLHHCMEMYRAQGSH